MTDLVSGLPQIVRFLLSLINEGLMCIAPYAAAKTLSARHSLIIYS
jgi:hypothetical protein